MDTIIYKMDNDEDRDKKLELASNILKAGGLVAFPTETVYGLGADALNPEAAHKIYEAKGRPSDNPLIVHIAHFKDIEVLAYDIPVKAYKLAETFWPGPLTIILKKRSIVPHETTGGLDTVAIRMPAHKLARELISRSGVYVAAPSANLSGKPSPTSAEHVINDLYGRIDMVLDGGRSTYGLESTVIDLTVKEPVILRPGCVTKSMLENVVGPVGIDEAIMHHGKADKDFVPKAPGMKYRHYAPEGSLVIYEGDTDRVTEAVNAKAKEYLDAGKSVGIIATDETLHYYKYGTIKSIGSRMDEDSIAAGLYATLREFDEINTEFILSESFSDNHYGQAIMNRLLKAAGYHIINVS
jgi:L-threonylcarbamoyladenylate synthase